MSVSEIEKVAQRSENARSYDNNLSKGEGFHLSDE